jgi:hypothetical protein
MRIAEAAETVLKDLGRAVHVRELAEEISKRGLYEFKTKDPAGVIAKALRKHCEGVAGPGNATVKRSAAGTFELL